MESNKKVKQENLRLSASMWRFIRENDDNKICRILRKLGAAKYENLYNNSTTTNSANYLTFRNDGTISFLPFGKELKHNDSGEWSRENRQNGKASKVIRKILHQTILPIFNDSDFEAFSNLYKATGEKERKTIKILPRTEIINVYCMNIERGDGSLNGSCMNNDSDYLEIYQDCSALEIVVMLNNDEHLSARALLWTLGNGRKLMDRIYTTQDHYFELMLDYAKEKEFIVKTNYKTYDYKDKFTDTIDGRKFQETYKIQCPTKFEYYPYIDTFSYGGDGYLTNDENDSNNIYKYNETSGGRGEEQRGFCELNQCSYPEEELRYIDRGRYRGMYIHEDFAIEVDEYYYWAEDDLIVLVQDNWYTKDSDDICYVDGHDEYFLAEECVYSEDKSEYILLSESYCIDGDYYHEDDVEEVTAYKVNGELYKDAERG